jgi:hypothetical protein
MLNANAFYEMGIRHMKQKPIIHMYRDGDKIPFDVAPYRAIPFSFVHPDDLTAAKNLLKRAVDEVLKPNFQVENPVTRARGVQKLEEHATDSERVLLSQLEAIQDRLQSLEDNSFRGPSKFVALSDIGLFSDDNPLTWQSHARRMKAPSFKFIEVTLTPTDDTDELAEANARAFGAVRAKFPKADFSIIRQDDHCTTIRVGSGFANPIEMYLLSLPEVDRAQTVAVQG